MNIDTAPNGMIRLTDIYEPILLETIAGNKLEICIRDGLFEISVQELNGNWKDIRLPVDDI